MTTHGRSVADTARGRGPERGAGGPGHSASPGGVARSVPSWLLRAVLGAASAGAVTTVALWTGTTLMGVLLPAVAAAWTVIRPASHAATVLIALVAVLVVTTDPGPSGWLIPAVLGVHATHVLAALGATIPWRSAVELVALRPSWRRFVTVQAASQALVVLALLISG